jgi:GntR family transcriptional regulator
LGCGEQVAEQTHKALAGARLDHSSPVPLYHQAAQVLERAIEDGRLPRGSKLEGELDLAEQLGISRPTMRAALKQLVDKGLLIRRRGIGTMVATKPVRRAIALTSLYDDLKESGREPTTRVLDFEETGCPPEVAEQLELGPAAPVLRFDRLRIAGDNPIALMHNFVPVGLLGIEREDLELTGLYDLFRRAGITPHVATQRVGARKANDEEAELLEMEAGDPVLTMTRTAYDTAGRPIEYGSHSYPAETYWLEMMLAGI